MKRALVLSSGGIDSTTCLAIAVKKYGRENVSSLSCFYGQKHDKELVCARNVANYYGVYHYECDLSSVMQFSNCSLLSQSTEEVAHGSYEEQVKEGELKTYVPFRNGLLLSSVAALALSIYPDDEVDIYYGAHADDAAGSAYADCTPEFTAAMRKAIKLGTYGKIHVKDPLIRLNKAGVVKRGLKLKVPYELTWSCYEGKDKACGKCGTCIDRLNAFKANGVEDPIEYE